MVKAKHRLSDGLGKGLLLVWLAEATSMVPSPLCVSLHWPEPGPHHVRGALHYFSRGVLPSRSLPPRCSVLLRLLCWCLLRVFPHLTPHAGHRHRAPSLPCVRVPWVISRGQGVKVHLDINYPKLSLALNSADSQGLLATAVVLSKTCIKSNTAKTELAFLSFPAPSPSR